MKQSGVSALIGRILANRLALAVVLLVVGLASAVAVGLAMSPGDDSSAEYASQITTAGLSRERASALTQNLQRSGYAGIVHVAAILTPPEFYPLTNRPQEAADYGADRYLVFVTNEHLHSGELPRQFAPIVRLDGASIHVPSEVRVLVDAGHLRTTVLVYKDVPAAVHKQSHRLELLLPAADSGARTALEWLLPIELLAN